MKNIALFLDRDGVINHDKGGYTYKIEDLSFMDGIFELCLEAQKKGYLIVVVTNQSGIARGYYSENDFLSLTEFIHSEFYDKGIKIAKTYYCPFHEDGVLAEYRKDSFDRKPNPGMIFKARDDFFLDLSKSILVGDKESDIMAARNAKLRTAVLYSKKEGIESAADYIVSDLVTIRGLL